MIDGASPGGVDCPGTRTPPDRPRATARPPQSTTAPLLHRFVLALVVGFWSVPLVWGLFGLAVGPLVGRGGNDADAPSPASSVVERSRYAQPRRGGPDAV